jgi:hypothetical protein
MAQTPLGQNYSQCSRGSNLKAEYQTEKARPNCVVLGCDERTLSDECDEAFVDEIWKKKYFVKIFGGLWNICLCICLVCLCKDDLRFFRGSPTCVKDNIKGEESTEECIKKRFSSSSKRQRYFSAGRQEKPFNRDSTTFAPLYESSFDRNEAGTFALSKAENRRQRASLDNILEVLEKRRSTDSILPPLQQFRARMKEPRPFTPSALEYLNNMNVEEDSELRSIKSVHRSSLSTNATLVEEVDKNKRQRKSMVDIRAKTRQWCDDISNRYNPVNIPGHIE